MGDSSSTPLYATLLYDVRRELDISFTEYVYLDMVHKLSYRRWCNKSLAHCASDLGISKFGALRMRDRLIARGYLEKNAHGELKVTPAYTEVAVNKVGRVVGAPATKVDQSATKVQRIGHKSATKNNKRNTENIGKGFEKYKAMRAKVLGA